MRADRYRERDIIVQDDCSCPQDHRATLRERSAAESGTSVASWPPRRDRPTAQPALVWAAAPEPVAPPWALLGDPNERGPTRQVDPGAFSGDGGLFRQFFDHLPVAASLKGLDGRYLRVNRRFAATLGLDPGQVVGRSDEDLFPPEVATEARDRDRRTLQADAPLEFDAAAGPFGVSLLQFPVRDASGAARALGVIAGDPTERRRADRDRPKWDPLYQAAAEAAGLIFYDWDLESETLRIAGASEAILGIPPEELSGGLDRWLEWIHPDDIDSFLASIDQAIVDPRPLLLQYRMRRKDGRVIVVRDEGRSVDAEQGRPPRFVGFVYDVTDRVRAEEALQASERRFRAVFHQTFQFEAILAPDGTVLEVNSTALSFGGLGREEVVGRPFWETRWWAASPESRDRIRAALAEAATGKVVRFEEQVQGAGGRVAIFDVAVKPVFDESGAVTMLIPEGHDITPHKQAERELAGALRELGEIMDTVPDLLYTLDLEGRLVRWNRRLEEVTGLGPELLRGRSSLEFFMPEDHPAVVEAIHQSLRHGFGNLEARLVCDDGILTPYQFTSAPLRDPSGRVIGLTGVGRDMTAHLALEDALREQVETIGAINRVGRLLASERHPDALARAITDTAVGLTGARFGVLVSGFDDDDEDQADRKGDGEGQETLPFWASSGSGLPRRMACAASAFAGPLGPAFRGEGVVRLAEAGPDLGLDLGLGSEAGPGRWGGVGHAPGLPPPSSVLAVPLATRPGVVLGVLLLGHEQPGVFTDRAEQLAAGLAAQGAIALENARLVDGLQRARAEMEAAYDATIDGWARALEFRDHETEGHSRRVTELTARLASAMGVPEADLVHIRRGALLHDIGKMAIPDRILNKPGPLDDEERRAMKRHPEYACALLSPIPFLRPALAIPCCHHERWDGTGYPSGLRGEQIPLSARIFAAADIFDALSHDRPYRRAWPTDRVLDYLESLSGTHLDPAVVAAFLRLCRPEATA